MRDRAVRLVPNLNHPQFNHSDSLADFALWHKAVPCISYLLGARFTERHWAGLLIWTKGARIGCRLVASEFNQAYYIPKRAAVTYRETRSDTLQSPEDQNYYLK